MASYLQSTLQKLMMSRETTDEEENLYA